jgi:diaminopimelate epimerase
VRFTKAHGLANDFILVAESDAPVDPSAWTRRLCDRHRGIGADGIVLHAPAAGGVRFQLINADGLPVEISGNGLRCLAALAFRKGWAPAQHVVHTVVGPKPVEVRAIAESRYSVTSDLGTPVLGSAAIPLALDPPLEEVIDLPIEAAGHRLRVTCTSMGNPHCAIFCSEVADDALLGSVGPALERHPVFPQRTNVEFVTVLSRSEIRVRFWERGVGYTQASGTGSASAVVASIITGRTERRVKVLCDGGTLHVEWPVGGTLRQTGEAEILFEGEWLPGSFGEPGAEGGSREGMAEAAAE